MSSRICLLALACLAAGAFAEEKPAVAFPEGNLACFVTVTYRDFKPPPVLSPEKEAPPDPSSPGIPLKAEIQRISGQRQMFISWSSGQVTRAWQPGSVNMTFFRVSGTAQIASQMGTGGLPAVFGLDANREWWGWAGRGNRVGEVPVNGRLCQHYRQQVEIPNPNVDLPPIAKIYELWVDKETLQPMAFSDGDARYDLLFTALSQPGATLPADVRKEIERYQAILNPGRRR